MEPELEFRLVAGIERIAEEVAYIGGQLREMKEGAKKHRMTKQTVLIGTVRERNRLESIDEAEFRVRMGMALNHICDAAAVAPKFEIAFRRVAEYLLSDNPTGSYPDYGLLEAFADADLEEGA